MVLSAGEPDAVLLLTAAPLSEAVRNVAMRKAIPLLLLLHSVVVLFVVGRRRVVKAASARPSEHERKAAASLRWLLGWPRERREVWAGWVAKVVDEEANVSSYHLHT